MRWGIRRLTAIQPEDKAVSYTSHLQVTWTHASVTDATENKLAEAGEVTQKTVSQDTDALSHDIDDNKYLISNLHCDIDYEMELFKTVEVVEETLNEKEGPIIVAYRRRVSATEKLLPMTEDDEYFYQKQDILQMMTDYIRENPAKTTNLPETVKLMLSSQP